jgi:hypothetical protein
MDVAPTGRPPNDPAPPARRWSRFLAALRRRPLLCLFLLTPGFAEYLSGSSSFVTVIASPPFFFLQLGINAAMYLPGALLIREALIRWHKGWPTAFALGAAYGIMEEGIADQTILNPAHSPIGAAGTYGHFLGVNWLWLPTVLVIHILFSICLPILLLNYALPEYRHRSLLSLRGVGVALVVIAVDTAVLTVLVSTVTGYWYGVPMLIALLVAIAGLCGLGYRLPKFLFATRPGPPTASPLWFFLAGVAVYPGMLLVNVAGIAARLPPAGVFLAVGAVPVVLFSGSLHHIGTERNERPMVAFAAGVIVFSSAIGTLTEWVFPVILVADLATILFFQWLYRELGDGGHLRGPAAFAPS